MRERALLIGARLTIDTRPRAAPRCASPFRSGPKGNDAGPEPTRILLADDHALVRRGVRLILDGEPDLTVVAEAGDGAEAVEQARPAASTWPSSTSPCPA